MVKNDVPYMPLGAFKDDVYSTKNDAHNKVVAKFGNVAGLQDLRQKSLFIKAILSRRPVLTQ